MTNRETAHGSSDADVVKGNGVSVQRQFCGKSRDTQAIRAEESW